jgi:hypothetical protein
MYNKLLREDTLVSFPNILEDGDRIFRVMDALRIRFNQTLKELAGNMHSALEKRFMGTLDSWCDLRVWLFFDVSAAPRSAPRVAAHVAPRDSPHVTDPPRVYLLAAVNDFARVCVRCASTTGEVLWHGTVIPAGHPARQPQHSADDRGGTRAVALTVAMLLGDGA